MAKVQNSDKYGLKRLESKNARNAIIQNLAVGIVSLVVQMSPYARLMEDWFNSLTSTNAPQSKIFNVV